METGPLSSNTTTSLLLEEDRVSPWEIFPTNEEEIVFTATRISEDIIPGKLLLF